MSRISNLDHAWIYFFFCEDYNYFMKQPPNKRMGTRIRLSILIVLLITGGGMTTTGCRHNKDEASVAKSMWQSSYGQVSFLNGYAKAITGEHFRYHSPLSETAESLLVRSEVKTSFIEWETVPVPPDYAEEKVTFAFLAGLDVNPEGHTFELSVDGEPVLKFSNPPDHSNRKIAVQGKHGCELVYDVTQIDRHDDFMGFMYLLWPKNLSEPGKPLRIRVRGESAGSRAWFMVFKHTLEQTLTLLNEPSILRTEGKPSQSIRVEVVHLEDPVSAVFSSAGHETTFRLQFGHNLLRLPVPLVQKERDITVNITIGEEHLPSAVLRLKPVVEKKIYILHHSHVDIGYTDVQDEVEKKQWANLESAMTLAENSRANNEGSRFKWNSEVLWPVVGYLEQAAEEDRARFFEACRRGEIGLDALYANELTGLCRPEELLELLRFARTLKTEHGLPIEAAMITDIPGYSWGLVPSLVQSGVKYLSCGPNIGHRIGHIFKEWADRPFYWESPSGQEQILCWVHGKGYSWFHTGLNYKGLKKRLKDEAVFDYLTELEQTGYPYDIVSFRYNIGSDNGPTDEYLADVVEEWNTTYISPRLIIATTAELFRDFEKQYGAGLPVFKGDFTGHWEDGAGSSAKETALNRRAAERLVQAQTLHALYNRAAFPQDKIDAAWKNILLYDEHTWGSWNSISEPHAEFTLAQWRIKQAFALDADRQTRELLEDALPVPGRNGQSVDSLDIHNTGSRPRTDLVLIPSSIHLVGDGVRDDTGRRLPSQRLTGGELAVLIRDVPAFGFRRLFFDDKMSGLLNGGQNICQIDDRAMSNGLIRLSLDENGHLRELSGTGGTGSWVNESAGFDMPEYLYVEGRDPNSPLRSGPARISVGEKGPLVVSFLVESEAPGCRSLLTEYRLTAGLPHMDVFITVDKKDVYDPEAVYIVWPFAVPDGKIRMDLAWGHFTPEEDQLPGACKNFFSVQRWIDISNPERGITLTTVDAPLFEVGALTADPIVVGWLEKVREGMTLFAYLMNNYWETNYKASQEGPVTFQFALHAHEGEFSGIEADLFGRERSRPLLLSSAETPGEPGESFLTLSSQNIRITSIKPAVEGEGWIVRLYNPGHTVEHVELKDPDGRALPLFMSSLFEKRGTPLTGPVTLEPMEFITLVIGEY